MALVRVRCAPANVLRYAWLKRRLRKTSMVQCEKLENGENRKHDATEGFIVEKSKRPAFVKDKQTYDVWNPWKSDEKTLDIANIAKMCTAAGLAKMAEEKPEDCKGWDIEKKNGTNDLVLSRGPVWTGNKKWFKCGQQ
jgi:hypothetical protein